MQTDLFGPRPEEALTVLADLHGKGDPNDVLVQLEYAEIREQVAFERTQGAKSYFDLFRPGVARRVVLGCSLQMWSQLTGMNIMMYVWFYCAQQWHATLSCVQVLYRIRVSGCRFNGTTGKSYRGLGTVCLECALHE